MHKIIYNPCYQRPPWQIIDANGDYFGESYVTYEDAKVALKVLSHE